LMLAFAGCTTPELAPERPPVIRPTVRVSERTWRQVDRDISAASLAASEPARDYARGLMDGWISRVRKRTEEDFIRWYVSYWTQQWLAIKVGWYKLSKEEGADSTAKRLAAYLQEQFHERVLAPVAAEIDPETVREQAATRYVQILGERLQEIPQRYGVPPDLFDERLKSIPAIALAPPPSNSASVYQIIHADPLATLPAYMAVTTRIRTAAGGEGDTRSEAAISPVAKRAAEKLLEKLAISGGASAAAAAMGGIPGIVISLGAAGYGAVTHGNERPALEAEVRETLSPALDEMWLDLVDEPTTGVMAGVYYISGQIAESLAKNLVQPGEIGPPP